MKKQTNGKVKISVITPSIRCEGLKVVQECLKNQTFKDFEWLVELGLGDKHDLNASYNRALKRAKGELIVSWQDFLWVEDDGLQKFWDAYQEHGDVLMTAPVGKTDDLEDRLNAKWDWRKHKTGEEVEWLNWEIDWGACPLKILKEIGGFDEELDKYWSFDNVNVGCRADLAGYKVRCIDNPAVAYDHDAHIEHPFRKDYNPKFHNQRLDEFRMGLKIDYL